MRGPGYTPARREDPRDIQRGFDFFHTIRQLRRDAMQHGEPGLLAGSSLLLVVALIATVMIAAVA